MCFVIAVYVFLIVVISWKCTEVYLTSHECFIDNIALKSLVIFIVVLYINLFYFPDRIS